jgi:hypothetical protein
VFFGRLSLTAEREKGSFGNQKNFLKTEEGESLNRYRSEGSSNATHTKV